MDFESAGSDSAGCEESSKSGEPPEVDSHLSQACNPALPLELTEENEETLHGDAIGDTLYSERWVIKVLMKLAKLTDDLWTAELDQDLCTLWDMTTEPAVTSVLMAHDMLSLVLHVLKNQTEPNYRLMEVLWGVLANMCCERHVRLKLMEHQPLCQLLFVHLSECDALTNVQLMRVIHTCVWELYNILQAPDVDESIPEVTSSTEVRKLAFMEIFSDPQNWYPQVEFMLNSCTNAVLLFSCLQMLDTLATSAIIGSFWPEDLTGVVSALNEALMQITECAETEETFSKFTVEKAGCYWMALLSGLCCSEPGKQAIKAQAAAIATRLDCHLVNCSVIGLEERQAQFLADTALVLQHFMFQEDTFSPEVFRGLLSVWHRFQDIKSPDSMKERVQLQPLEEACDIVKCLCTSIVKLEAQRASIKSMLKKLTRNELNILRSMGAVLT